jgi:dihydroorotase
VRGVKAHAEIGGASRWGLDVVKLGKRIASELGVPLYIHLGQIWPLKDGTTVDPDEVVRALMPLMEPSDVLAHPFTRHPGGFVSAETGEVHPVVWAALGRGVTVDVGHGSQSSFEMARRTLNAGIRPHTLGADLHGYNVRQPGGDATAEQNPFFGIAPFNLTIAMTELMALGMSLPDIIATVTSGPARMVRMEDKIGSLAIGREADISVLDLLRGRFTLSDNSGEKMTSDQMLAPAFALRAGKPIRADSPLIPPATLLAA